VIDADALVRVQDASYESVAQSLTDSWPQESVMDAAQLESFLDERRYCVLATTTVKGHAQARPVAFTVFGAAFWFATVAGARLRNLKRTPWVSVVVADGEGDSHRAVVAEGSTVIVERPPEELLSAWEARHGSRADWASVWFEVEPVRIFSYRAPGAPA
jgi:nitroimidazol reductase NimA-like FMN-containing flavoprotein (pyridoxamine 5'-phosphate oxidase superfamily)